MQVVEEVVVLELDESGHVVDVWLGGGPGIGDWDAPDVVE